MNNRSLSAHAFFGFFYFAEVCSRLWPDRGEPRGRPNARGAGTTT